MSRWAFATAVFGLGALLAGGLAGCGSSTTTTTVVDVSDSEAGDTPRPEKTTKKEPSQEKPGAAFALPGDATGKLLAKVLPPSALSVRSRPAASAMAGHLSPFRLPEMPPPAATGSLLRLPTPSAKGMSRPDFVLEESLEWLDSPDLPKAPLFETGTLQKEDAPDVALPPPLPALATSSGQRISLDDPTMEVSTAAVLTAPLLSRSKPLPFERVSKPEPYAHRIPLTLPVPEEGATPRGATPAVPR